MKKSAKNIPLSPSVCYKHILLYSQYAKNETWARWYSSVAPLKAQRVINVLLRYKKPDAKVLDLGCGTGMTLAGIAQTFPNTVGLDIGESEIKATKELLHTLKTKATVLKYDSRTIPFPADSFDIVTSIEVIEHVRNPMRMLKEIKRVLKKDGILHITTANKWWPIEPHFQLPFLSWLPSRLADSYVRISKRGENYHSIKLPSYRQFRTMVERDFIVNDITLDVIQNFKEFGLDKERGSVVRFVGKGLSLFNGNLPNWLKLFLSNISLGWLFIASPRK